MTFVARRVDLWAPPRLQAWAAWDLQDPDKCIYGLSRAGLGVPTHWSFEQPQTPYPRALHRDATPAAPSHGAT
jgi:hypothetical protein